MDAEILRLQAKVLEQDNATAAIRADMDRRDAQVARDKVLADGVWKAFQDQYRKDNDVIGNTQRDADRRIKEAKKDADLLYKRLTELQKKIT